MKLRTTFFIFFSFIYLLSAQEMTLFLGLKGYEYYEDDRPLITAEVESLLSENAFAYESWKKSRTQNKIALVSGVTSLGTTVALLARKSDSGKPGALVATSIGTAVLSGILSLSANNLKKKAVLTYNKGLKKPLAIHYQPLLNRQGFGFIFQY